MLVRLAREHEVDTIADVFIPSFGGLTFLPRLHTDEETRNWIREVVLPGHELWVAEVDDRVVGFAALTEDLLGHMYVHPDQQGELALSENDF